MNPDFVPQDENRASETTSSVMELSRASILQETAASFGQARIESDAFSPLAVDRRQASVQGGLQQRTRVRLCAYNTRVIMNCMYAKNDK